ncbi:hypothetical protein [Streptomyces sp. 1222.5]|uniref:hypothetical protein n=1 Tax=Streptomyces sp. 1222.5 TaxID=1881026 RepID=UPI003D711C45
MAGLVAQIYGLRRRLALLPAPTRSSGQASNGEPVQVELFINGAWVDTTSVTLVRDDGGQIAITSGIRDEGSQTEAGTCSLELDNRDGSFSPRNPSSQYYGLIGRNTPIRISVPDGTGAKSYRIWGEVSEWAPHWDKSGSDVWTSVSANGLLRRLAQGPVPERSVVYSAFTDPLPSSVVAYWPCEDPSGSTSLKSALTSGSPMTWSGVPNLASYSNFSASDPLPDLTTAALSGGVPKYSDPSATQVRFFAYIPAAGLAEGKVLCAIDQLDYSAGSPQFFELYYSTVDATNSLVLKTCASDGTDLGALLPHTLEVRGRLLYVSIELQESGANITRTIRLVDVPTGRSYVASDTEFVTQLTRVTRVQFGPKSRSVAGGSTTSYLPGVAVGHVTVENQITAIDALGVRLNPIGETAGRRMQRLCGEQGLAFEWVGDLDDTVAMGAQPRQNLLSQLQECALADGGLLYESRAGFGLGYRTRASLYNQDPVLTLDYTAGQLAQVPVPVEDDRYIQNKVTVTVGGVSATYEETSGNLGTELPPAGVGTYGQDLTLNLSSTDTPTIQDQAAWRVHLGTVDEARFPQISVNLAHPSITADMRRAIIAMRPGDRIQISNPPSWLPPDTIDQLVLGTSETITHFEHKLTFNCQPASPYSSMAYLDASSTRLDTDGSELVASISSSSTLMGVKPSDPYEILWTKDTNDFPLDVKISGEVIRVSSITDWVTDTFARTVSNGWGTSDSGFAWTTGGGSASDYSVSGGVGAHLLASVAASRRCFANTTVPDMDIYVSLTADQLATGDSLIGGVTSRYVDSDNLYQGQLRFTSANAVQVVIIKRVATVETVLGTYTMPGVTFVANTFYRLRFQLKGTRLRAKGWLASDAETPEWQVTVYDGDLSSAGLLGFRSISGSGSTNVNPSIKYDDYAIVSPQIFNITRSVNGVSKAHAVGEDVRLATSTYLGL